MYVKQIEYVDFNGTERKEDFYFHLSLPELTRIESGITGTFKEHIEELTASNKKKELLEFLELVMLTSYGVKSEDGRSFNKSPELTKAFENSQAYAEFFEMLLTEEGMAQEFGEKVGERRKVKSNKVTPIS